MKQVSKLVLGTVQFGCQYGINSAGRPSQDDVKAILDEASANGITTLDTSCAYGDAEQVLGMWLESYADPAFYQWAIVPKELGEPVGTISVVQMNEKIDLVHIGYCIGHAGGHQGITSEAFGAIIPFFFREVGVNRIESRHDVNNPNSGKVMKKCGLQYEGTLRQADWSNQGIVDVSYYGLLRQDWEKSLI